MTRMNMLHNTSVKYSIYKLQLRVQNMMRVIHEPFRESGCIRSTRLRGSPAVFGGAAHKDGA